jgi:hypothetical protein
MLSDLRLTQYQIWVLSDILEFNLKIDNLLGVQNYVQDALSCQLDYIEPLQFSKSSPLLVESTLFLESYDKEKYLYK